MILIKNKMNLVQFFSLMILISYVDATLHAAVISKSYNKTYLMSSSELDDVLQRTAINSLKRHCDEYNVDPILVKNAEIYAKKLSKKIVSNNGILSFQKNKMVIARKKFQVMQYQADLLGGAISKMTLQAQVKRDNADAYAVQGDEINTQLMLEQSERAQNDYDIKNGPTLADNGSILIQSDLNALEFDEWKNNIKIRNKSHQKAHKIPLKHWPEIKKRSKTKQRKVEKINTFPPVAEPKMNTSPSPEIRKNPVSKPAKKPVLNRVFNKIMEVPKVSIRAVKVSLKKIGSGIKAVKINAVSAGNSIIKSTSMTYKAVGISGSKAIKNIKKSFKIKKHKKK